MSHSSALATSLDALVHEGARDCPIEHARHAHFIRLRLGLPLLAAISAPLLLALEGAPPVWQSLAFALAMLPLLAVVLAARRGALAEGHMICVAAFAGIALVAALGAGPGMGVAAFLTLMPFEAALTRSATRIGAATLAALVIGASLFAAGVLLPHPGQLPAADIILASAAGLYAFGLAQGWRREMRAGDRLLRDARTRRDSMAALVDDAVLRFSRDGAVVAAGHDCEVALNLRARDVSGRGFCERVLVADRPIFLKAIADAAAGRRVTARLRLHTRDIERGTFLEPVYAHVDMRAGPAEFDGEIQVMALLRDVTGLVDAQVSVERNERRERDWKDRLLANVSHELRTPLNAIIGFSEMLASQAAAQDEAQRREYAGIIHESGQHLLSVVNSLLDMSQIDAGAVQVEAEAFELAPLVDNCCDILRLKASEAKIVIARDFPAGPGVIVADKRACRQILLNLLSNAIKFTPAGGRVTIGLRHEHEALALYVADTGIGIHAPDLPRIGDPFFQAQDRRAEGTGLGLSVVKGLVGLHGGAISVESAPGQGTCVTVRLPLDCRKVQPAPTQGATIETIPRRAAAPLTDVTMVKKIA